MSEPPAAARVRVLDVSVANQIAAGEVVERPASVLKELIENSLDAGATTLTIDLERGGARLIRVRDDGAGIHPDDLGLAVRRHGTSKLARIEDLDHLITLGFRGEALASIASVSRFVIRSRVAGHSTGWELAAGADAGAATPVPVAMPPGTVVEVRDLFFNTPARRRFLRTERTELGHLEAVLRHAALGRCDVGVVARHDDRRLLAVPSGVGSRGHRPRVAAILGRAFAQQARWLECEASGMHLSGWVLPAPVASTVSLGQYFFVNARAVRDPVARHALGAAYEGLLPPGHQASFVLYLGLPADQVDVNVHPTKSEVRFRESRNVHDFLLASVRRILSACVEGPAVPDPVPPRALAAPPEPRLSPPPPRRAAGYPDREPSARAAIGDASRGYGPSAPAAGPGAVLLTDRYALVEEGPSLVLLDVAATLEEVARRALTEALDGAPLTPRPLLLPASRCVAVPVEQWLAREAPVLERMGVGVRSLEPGVVSLRHVPRVLRRADPGALLESLLVAEGCDSSGLVDVLARAAGTVDADLRAAAREAYATLCGAGLEPAPPWGRRLDADVLARWLGTGM